MDSSVEKVLRCLEKKQLSVLSVDKIDRKIYVKGEKIDEKKFVNRIVLPSSRDVPFLEYKGGVFFSRKVLFRGYNRCAENRRAGRWVK